MDAALRRTVDRLEPSQTAVVVTSGGPVSWVAATPARRRLPRSGRRLNPVTVNSSVTKVVVGRRGATLVSFNDHSHLEGDGRPAAQLPLRWPAPRMTG